MDGNNAIVVGTRRVEESSTTDRESTRAEDMVETIRVKGEDMVETKDTRKGTKDTRKMEDKESLLVPDPRRTTTFIDP